MNDNNAINLVKVVPVCYWAASEAVVHNLLSLMYVSEIPDLLVTAKVPKVQATSLGPGDR